MHRDFSPLFLAFFARFPSSPVPFFLPVPRASFAVSVAAAGAFFFFSPSSSPVSPFHPPTSHLSLPSSARARFCDLHGFEKPNDDRGLALMDDAARGVAELFPQLRIGFGESDEYSFVFPPDFDAYGRRGSKIVSLAVSAFTAAYVMRWPDRFPGVPLRSAPLFDGRVVCYPTTRQIRDYLAWRQVDTHINNLYNVCFWALVQKQGKTTTQAHETLRGTRSDFKNELLFSTFGINYNDLPQRHRKGSVLVWEEVERTGRRGASAAVEAGAGVGEGGAHCAGDSEGGEERAGAGSGEGGEGAASPGEATRTSKKRKTRAKRCLVVVHEDIIKDAFYEQRPYVLAPGRPERP